MKSLLLATLTVLAINTAQADGVKRIWCKIPAVAEMSRDEMLVYLHGNKVKLLNAEQINDQDLSLFLGSFERFPKQLHNNIINEGGSVLLLNGTGVSEDPNWDRNDTHTVDEKRLWTTIPGSGGFPQDHVPTRIVINRLKEGHGSVNLYLHEHGHTLDAIYGEATISKSQGWLTAMAATPNLTDFLNVWSPDGYNSKFPLETFAELFAQYHACDESRVQMETHIPLIADFFKNLTDASVYQKIKPLPRVDGDEVVKEAKEAFNGLRDRLFGRRKPKTE